MTTFNDAAAFRLSRNEPVTTVPPGIRSRIAASAGVVEQLHGPVVLVERDLSRTDGVRLDRLGLGLGRVVGTNHHHGLAEVVGFWTGTCRPTHQPGLVKFHERGQTLTRP